MMEEGTMAVDKLLGSVARDLAHRHFTPAEMRTGTDVIGHIWYAARVAKVEHVRVDVMAESVEPSTIGTHDIREALVAARADLRRLLREHDIGPDHVVSVRAELHFAGNRFTGELSILDARGKRHVAALGR
jgi:hypothetical protein